MLTAPDNPTPVRSNGARRTARPRADATLGTWLRAQSLNVGRHAAALRDFARDEFGAGPPGPTEAHVLSVNQLLGQLRTSLQRASSRVGSAVNTARRSPSRRALQNALREKERAHEWVQRVERIWDFYFELFGQRQTRFGNWLLGCDRIALDCYKACYLGLGTARSIPTPPAFSYMRTGFSPATFRRGIPLRRLGKQLNPFPLIQLPYHRLVNPWTLGAVLHEVGHNLQNDLGLADAIPSAIYRRLVEAGIPPSVATIWRRWNRETFADLIGLLLGGPAVVASLMDVIGRSQNSAMHFRPRAPHPTPYFRTFLSTELLARMGFRDQARAYCQAWRRIYSPPVSGQFPPGLAETFGRAHRLVVDTMCFQPYPSLGNKSLSRVVRFEPKDEMMVVEAAERLSRGIDPGVVPERFLIGASRVAFDRRLAAPERITTNFFAELARR
jgi:hypothetical protein